MFAAILAGMLWMSGASLKWLLALGAIGVALIPFAWNNLLRDYQKARLESFLNPQVDVQGSGYQLYQAQIAVGSGGWIGKGLTNGTQGQGDYPRPDHRLRVRGPRGGASASSARSCCSSCSGC